VINGIQTSDIRNLFNPENIFISKEGGGAGNNWASGFTQGEQVQETLLDMIGRRHITLKGGHTPQQQQQHTATFYLGGAYTTVAAASHKTVPQHSCHDPGQSGRQGDSAQHSSESQVLQHCLEPAEPRSKSGSSNA
jgi:hypothetical protein